MQFPELVPIPGGTFRMGNDAGRPDERPAHMVAVAPFRAAITPVTNLQYDFYLADSGIAGRIGLHEPDFKDPQKPVVRTDWFEAVAYCEWLRLKTGIASRLPTEAEGEFAALGGLTGDWPWPGSEHPSISMLDAAAGPHIPGLECANGYGLRCMADNVHEWCSDWYAANYYRDAPSDSPRGPATGARRASRGGSWRHQIKVTRVNARSSLGPLYRYADFGFRVYADA